ncbi:MAG: glycosyltransferase, partial [Candidatus Eiseniibacteriota bacterium]
GGDPALRARLGLAPDRVYALTLGNMAPLKRIDRVIRTIAVLARDAGAPRVDALIGGDGHLRHQLERLAHDLGVGDRVRFLGAVDHATVPDLMAAVDLYVAPHNLTNAGLPTCEAMLCGLPVVAMDAGTTRRTVRDGETGLVVALDDVDAMAAAVARLAADRALARRLGERGRALARERFMSWEDRTRMEVELLEGLADGG